MLCVCDESCPMWACLTLCASSMESLCATSPPQWWTVCGSPVVTACGASAAMVVVVVVAVVACNHVLVGAVGQPVLVRPRVINAS